MYWDNSNKYLGIGTSSPSSKLEVNGDITISSPNNLNLSYVTLGGSIRAGCLDYATLESTGTDQGIGVVVRAKGNPYPYGYAFQFLANGVGDNQLLFVGDASTQKHVLSTITSGTSWPLVFRVASSQDWANTADLMTLTSDQTVGIGTSNPGYTLDVNGAFHTTGGNVLSDLQGSGTRMVVADSSGQLSTQSMFNESYILSPFLLMGG